MRVAVDLLTENPNLHTGAQQFWSHLLAEMDGLLEDGEELYLLVSPACKPRYSGYGPQVRYITYPASGELRTLRSLSELFYSPLRLPLSGIDVLNAGIAPLLNPWSLVVHIKTMHAFAEPESVPPLTRLYRRALYPRAGRIAKAIIASSDSEKQEIVHHLNVAGDKVKIVHEGVNHAIFSVPEDRGAARHKLARHGIDRPFVLFVSHLYRHKNCHGLLKAWLSAHDRLDGRQLVFVGDVLDPDNKAGLDRLIGELGIGGDVVFTGPVSHEEGAAFYRAADLFVYPSFNETFGLTILEAMACGCPVITSNVTSMPEVAGNAALLIDPGDSKAIAAAMLEALQPAKAAGLSARGLDRAAAFTWRETARQTLDIYRSAMRG